MTKETPEDGLVEALKELNKELDRLKDALVAKKDVAREKPKLTVVRDWDDD